MFKKQRQINDLFEHPVKVHIKNEQNAKKNFRPLSPVSFSK